MALERQYTIPLRREWLKVPRHKRARKAVKAVREFLARHMKSDIGNIKVGRWLNELISERGEKKPPYKVRINASKDDKGIVRAELIELSERAQKVKTKEETRAKSIEQKKKDQEEQQKAAEEAAKKAMEEQKKAEEGKSDVEKEVAKEKEAIEDKAKHQILENKGKKDAKQSTGKDTANTQHQHPRRQVLQR